MFTTLDQLHHHIHHNKSERSLFGTLRREIKIVAGICLTVFVINSLVTNAQLYAEAVQSILHSTGLIQGLPLQTTTISHSTDVLSETIIDENYLQQKKAVESITTSLAAMNLPQAQDFSSQDIINSNLKQGLDTYSMDFNTLPPTSRIIIPRLAINAPIVQSSAQKPVDAITKDDFDKDLFHGVVQYPTTPSPGEIGNTFLFGHTSYESWKNNPYATIFSGLPKLDTSDIIQLISEGKIYTYKVIDKKIVSPSKVNGEYKKYTNGKYLTLLGCYPIGSDAQRIIIIGELVQ